MELIYNKTYLQQFIHKIYAIKYTYNATVYVYIVCMYVRIFFIQYCEQCIPYTHTLPYT